MKRTWVASLLGVCVLVAAQSAPASLIANWAADGNTVDSVAARNGTLVNGAGYGSGVVGQAFSLDGVNDYVSVPDDNVWTFGGDFTVALWANFDTIKQGPMSSVPNVFVAQDQGSGIQPKWIFFYDDSGQLVFHINGASPIFLASPSTFIPSLTEWHHYAVTRSGSTFTFYADGVSLGTAASSASIGNAAAPLTIGQAEGLGFFDGRLDEVVIYGNALSGAEVAQLATIPEPPTIVLTTLGILMLGWRLRNARIRHPRTALTSMYAPSV